MLERNSGLKAGTDFSVAYSPERVKANLVFRAPGSDAEGGRRSRRRIRSAPRRCTAYLGAPVDDVGTLEAAEMTKLLGMLYRDVNIALANELAAFCELAGVDFERVRAAANSDGEANLLLPGIGVGGHCTPVYPYFLTRESRRLGMTQRISEAAREINDRQPCAAARARRGRLETAARAACAHSRAGLPARRQGRHLQPAYALRDDLRDARRARSTIEDPYYSDDEIRAAGFEPGVPEAREGRRAQHRALASSRIPTSRRGAARASRWCSTVAICGARLRQKHAGLLYFGIGRCVSGGESTR